MCSSQMELLSCGADRRYTSRQKCNAGDEQGLRWRHGVEVDKEDLSEEVTQKWRCDEKEGSYAKSRRAL